MTRKQDQKITQLAKNLQSIDRKAVTAYEREINEIVDSNCREKRRIECTLDGILDFCFDKNMLLLYKKLCRYYYSIDLIKFTQAEAFKRWESSFLGIIVAVMLYEYDWRDGLQSSECGGASRWLSKDLRYAIDFITKTSNFEQIMQKICKNSGVRMDVADYISESLVRSIHKYNDLVLFSNLNKKDRAKSINQFINELENLPSVKQFMETVAFKYDMADFNRRMKYFFERHEDA